MNNYGNIEVQGQINEAFSLIGVIHTTAAPQYVKVKAATYICL